MKLLFPFLSLVFTVWLTGYSCKKTDEELPCKDSSVSRKVRFSLYTEKDFSGDNGNIVFTLTMRKNRGRVLWDSILPPMKIKDIPVLANKLVVEKTVPANDCSSLQIGFIYSIENVGMSWYWDKSKAGEIFKEVEFNFQ